MLALLERPGRILSLAQIEERIYGWGEEVESNAVDVSFTKFVRYVYGNTRVAPEEIIATLQTSNMGWLVEKIQIVQAANNENRF
jgi:two-component system OmpR family response regulator